MSYYDEYKEELNNRITDAGQKVQELSDQLAKAEERLENERDILTKNETDLKRLLAGAGDAIGTDNAFGRFRNKQQAARDAITASEKIVATLEGNVIPSLQSKLANAKAILEAAVSKFCDERNKQFQQRMTELMTSLLAERDDHYASMRRVCSESGLPFKAPSSRSTQQRIDQYMLVLSERDLIVDRRWPKVPDDISAPQEKPAPPPPVPSGPRPPGPRPARPQQEVAINERPK